MKQYRISELVKDMRPVWKSFIQGLGYSKDQAESFATGYENEISNLPTTEKLLALAQMHDDCMTAGFKEAGIDEDEAYARYG